MTEQLYRLVHNELIPMTAEETAERQLDEERAIMKMQARAENAEIRQQKLEEVKNRLGITDEEMDIIMNGV